MFLNGLNLNLGISCDRVVTFLLVVTLVLSGHYVDYKVSDAMLKEIFRISYLGLSNVKTC